MPWYVTAVLIFALVFALTAWAAERMAQRIHRGRPHRRPSEGGNASQQQLYDKVAHWDD